MQLSIPETIIQSIRYDYVKTAARRSPGLKSVADQLGERFKALRRRRTKATGDMAA